MTRILFFLTLLFAALLHIVPAQDATPAPPTPRRESEDERIARLAAETMARADERLAALSAEARATMCGPVARAMLAAPVGMHLLDPERIPAAHLMEGWPILLEELYARGYKPNSAPTTELEVTARSLQFRHRENSDTPEERITLEAALQAALIVAKDSAREDRVRLAQEILQQLQQQYPQEMEGERSLLDWRAHGDDWDMALEFMIAAPKDPTMLDPETFTAGLVLELEPEPAVETAKVDASKMTRDELQAATRAQIVAIRAARAELQLDRAAILRHLEANGMLENP